MKKICIILTITIMMTILHTGVFGDGVGFPSISVNIINCGDINCMVRDDGTMFVYSLNNEKELYIPAEINGMPVSGILLPPQHFGLELENITVDENNEYLSSEDGVLFNKDKTTLIKYPPKKDAKTYKVPDGVTEIGGFSFRLSSLERIELPDSVKRINYHAFSENYSLKEINLPDGITDIEMSAFVACESLENITLPKKLGKLDCTVFGGCKSLKSLTLPSKLREFDPRAVSGCTNLKEIKVELGNMAYDTKDNMLLKTLGRLVRYCCGSEEENFCIPNYVRQIGDYAFATSVNLKTVEIPEGVTTIGNEVFSKCSNLESLTIPESVRYFGSLFYECHSMKFLNIKRKISTLSEKYYEGAANLECICLPETLTELPRRFFRDNKHLKDIYFAGTQEEWGRVNRSKECPDSVTVHFNATDVTYIPSPEQTQAPSPTPSPTPVPAVESVPANTPSPALNYTLSVNADIPDSVSAGDIVPVNVLIDTTNGIQGIQFALDYDTDAFGINTSGNAYINSDWKSTFNALGKDSVPNNYLFTANAGMGKIAVLEYVDGGLAVREARALSNVSLMGVNLIVKDAEKAKNSGIMLSEIKVSSTVTNNIKCKTVNSQNNVSLFRVAGINDAENQNAVSITNLKDNSFTVNADTSKVNDGTIIVCLYDENGFMKEFRRVPVSEATDITLNNKGLVKVMWWDSLTNLCPQNKVFDFEF